MNNSLKIFFRYLVIGFLLATITSYKKDLSAVQFMQYSSFQFIWCLIVGIFIGMANMIGNDFYLWVKKN